MSSSSGPVHPFIVDLLKSQMPKGASAIDAVLAFADALGVNAEKQGDDDEATVGEQLWDQDVTQEITLGNCHRGLQANAWYAPGHGSGEITWTRLTSKKKKQLELTVTEAADLVERTRQLLAAFERAVDTLASAGDIPRWAVDQALVRDDEDRASWLNFQVTADRTILVCEGIRTPGRSVRFAAPDAEVICDQLSSAIASVPLVSARLAHARDKAQAEKTPAVIAG